jgi:hypothetical protein
MEAYMGAKIQLHSLTLVLYNGKCLTPGTGRFTPAKKTRYQLDRRLGASQSPSRRFREKKKLFPLPAFETQAFQSSRYTDCATRLEVV